MPHPRIVLVQIISLLAGLLLLAACAATPAATKALPTPAGRPLLTFAVPTPVRGRGEPRSGGYWEMWSTCGANSQAKMAAANGGRAAGWILLDDLLRDPGIQAGSYRPTACAQALSLLQARSQAGEDRSVDAAYGLAAQLAVAELNLAAGARSCPELEGAVIAAQAVLAGAGFDGRGSFLPAGQNEDARRTALRLLDQLRSYNSGGLCR